MTQTLSIALPEPMNWQRLLSKQRLGKVQGEHPDERSAFQKDVDRIVFSSAFRRLQDKTQVFPLAKNDYVRTRLTHSMEVASVGRSLATQTGEQIIQRHGLRATGEDFAAIVTATCLAHDIGNPPFGHFGEEAFRAFFKHNAIGQAILQELSACEQLDLLHYEGNAQGLRILTRLQHPQTAGGMQLTYATLGAFVKYPCRADAMDKSQPHLKKVGLFSDDYLAFAEVANKIGLLPVDTGAFVRHPLVYLMEAADDICYGIIDIEDAHQVRVLSFADAEALLQPLAGKLDNKTYHGITSKSEKISYLRAKAIGELVDQVGQCFLDNESEILAGKYAQSLSDDIAFKRPLKDLTDYAAGHIYNCSQVVKVEMAGYKVLTDLLGLFAGAIFAETNSVIHSPPQSASSKASDQMLLNLLPRRFCVEATESTTESNDLLYRRVLGVCDFLSGMTDSYAVSLHQQLMGVRI